MTTETTIDVEGFLHALEMLRDTNLTGAQFRVALTHLHHHLRTKRISWRWSNEILASKLGIHRNSVSQAYDRLEALGFISREVPKARKQASIKHWHLPLCWMPTQRAASRPTGPAPEMAAKVPATPPKAVCRHQTPNTAEARPQPLPVPRQACSPPSDHVTLDPLAFQRLLGRLPEEGRDLFTEATYQCNPTLFKPKASWGLTDDETHSLVSAIPKRLAGERTKNTSPIQARRGADVDQVVTSALAKALPALAQLTKGAGDLDSLSDQIAFSVSRGGLGNGDPAGGVRAALALIRSGRWSTPRGMPGDWRGAFARSMAAHGSTSTHGGVLH